MKSDSSQPSDAIPPCTPVSRIQSGQRIFTSSVIPTESLFQGAHEILIDHLGEHYRLRITKNGKLILTK